MGSSRPYRYLANQQLSVQFQMAKINPIAWLAVATERAGPRSGLTEWFAGTVSPVHVGLYERYFTDSSLNPPCDSLQYWDGAHWRVSAGGQAHWHQVGAYPAWRGMTVHFEAGQEVKLLRGSRGQLSGQGCERTLRARLESIDAGGNVCCTLLEDDPLATVAPTKAGERGYWHGLSFLAPSN